MTKTIGLWIVENIGIAARMRKHGVSDRDLEAFDELLRMAVENEWKACHPRADAKLTVAPTEPAQQ